MTKKSRRVLEEENEEKFNVYQEEQIENSLRRISRRGD